MAEEGVAHVSYTVAETASDMDVETFYTLDQTDGDATFNGAKQRREEWDVPEEEENSGEGEIAKVEKSVAEETLDKLYSAEGKRVTVGFKSFETSVEMFDYFHRLLHFWPTNLNLNKYEHIMLMDLLKKGYVEPEKKIKGGVMPSKSDFIHNIKVVATL